MILTPGQLDNLRDDHPHVTRAYLSVLKPAQVYCGTVGGVPSRGDRDITVVDVSGNIANVVAGQTILVGVSCGDNSISKRRLKSRVGQVLTVDENGVNWQVGDFVTVMENWELFPIYPRILNTTPYTMYKDYDGVYGNQNERDDPVAIMGPPWSGFLDGATVVAQLDGSASYAIAPGAVILSHAWAATGGAVADLNAAATYITFNAVGTYWVSLTVTDDNGKTHITRRPFFVHTRTGATAPYRGFRATVSLSHVNGATLNIDALDDASDWPDGTMLVLWTEELFDTVKSPIGYFSGREHIRFVGYISDGNISIDPEDVGGLGIIAVSVDRLLATLKMWSIALIDTTRSPASWYEYQNLTVARALRHYWGRHSTLFGIADVRLPISSILRKGSVEFPEGDLLGQAQQFAHDKGIFANIGCNKQGAVYVEIDPMMVLETNRGAIDTVQDITLVDWQDHIELVHRERQPLSWASLSGVLWNGAAGTPYIAVMPGSSPEIEGAGNDDVQFQMLSGQTDANQKVGLLYAKHNNDIREFRVPRLAGNYSHIDVYPQEFYDVTIAAADNKRGISIAARGMIPRSVTLAYNPDDSIVTVGAVMEPETVDVVDGIPGDYPTSVPMPEMTTYNPEPPKYPDMEAVPATLVAFTGGTGTYWSKDVGTSWAARNTGKAGTDSVFGYWDPWGPTKHKTGTYNPEKAILWDFGVGYIHRSVDAGRHWYDVTPATNPPNTWNDDPAPTMNDLTYTHAVADMHRNKTHYAIAYYRESGAYRGYMLVTEDDGELWIWYALGGNADAAVATWMPIPEGGLIPGMLCWGENGWGAVLDDPPGVVQDNPENVEGDPDGLYGGAHWQYAAQPGEEAFGPIFVVYDLGVWITLNAATVDGGANCKCKIGNCISTGSNNDNIYVAGRRDLRWIEPPPGDCDTVVPQALNEWLEFGMGFWPPIPGDEDTRARTTAYAIRYVQFSYSNGNIPDDSVQQYEFDYLLLYPHQVYDEIRPISLAMDWEDGTYLYMTVWEGNALRLRVYNLTSGLPILVHNIWLGNASRADIDARTYWACCKAMSDASVADYGQNVVVYGRWNDGAVRHIATSNDVGVTLVHIADAGWAAEWVGALKWVAQNDIVCVLNNGAPATLERWNGAAWTTLSNVDFDVDCGAMAMHMGALATIVIGQINGDDVDWQNTPYTGAWAAIDIGVAATRVGALDWVYGEVP